MSVSTTMSIVFIANHAHFLNHYYIHLLDYLESKGYQIIIVVPHPRENQYKGFAFPIYYLKYYNKMQLNHLYPLRICSELRQLIIDIKPAAILTFTLKISIQTVIACRKLKIPLMMTITGLGYLFTRNSIVSFISGYFLKSFLQPCPQVIFQNRTDYDLFLNRKWLIKKNIVLMNGSGIDLSYYKPIPYPPKDKIRLILYLGRIQYDKGLWCLVQSLKQLKKNKIPYRCLLAGPCNGGHPTDIPTSRIDTWEKEGLFRFIGCHKDVRPLIRQANVVIQPSKREGLSRTILEALACGRPVISSSSPGCAELICEAENGWIFPTNNVKKLTQLLTTILLMPYSILASMAQKTPESISTLYTNQAIQQHYGKLLSAYIHEKITFP
jgi:glycosyltransferase involved in cell wall biosynthesis